jgi:hypothetical protein
MHEALPGYDAWKLASPPEDPRRFREDDNEVEEEIDELDDGDASFDQERDDAAV